MTLLKEDPIICKVCDRGTLRRRTKQRMSWPVVIIGAILLIPSMLGMCIVTGLWLSSPLAYQIGHFVAGDSQAIIWIGTAIAAALDVSFLIFGLLGWLLVMEKKVLQCSVCRAVIDAA